MIGRINGVVFRFRRSGLTVRDGKRRRYGHLCTGYRRYRQHYLALSLVIPRRRLLYREPPFQGYHGAQPRPSRAKV